MVTQTMGSRRVGGNPIRTQTQEPKSNPLACQGSLYSLTLDEVQNELRDLGKPLSSMNLDELLKTVWSAETNNQAVKVADFDPAVQQPGQQVPSSSLNRQSSPTPMRDLSKKTVDEVWQDIQLRQKKNSLDRKVTLGEITLGISWLRQELLPSCLPGRKVWAQL
ncbi:ABSCISIC ACID-INSENSITIVE 5-like protein 2 [Olea europaea subsp. europaea]|uniref:ABSCISIC ACID-INSENSITIVE 5-like protein 2 n=1 Tax=Olea europaea subsp. europaea TaxID=158383 RepID=A0A8S0T005_OLEEU|nr:ABSCISIC ACID-INSENSITIVE 5-like protein 2 [Olea europaea subsp. europaea]